MKKSIIAFTVIIGMIAWSCSKVETGNNGLKQSVEKGVADINHALTKIAGSKAYQLLSLSEAAAKSGYNISDTINLGMVSGIYDFQPDTIKRQHHFCNYRLFKKTGESDNMVVNLPERMAFHPKYLHYYEPVDTVYPNNFTITATDYHVYYSLWQNHQYKLTAGLTLNNEDAGSMDIQTSSTSYHNFGYASRFTFPGEYEIAAVWQQGDTATSYFSLTHGNDTLFMEKSMIVHQGYHNREKQYELTIGAVEIKKTTGIDSIQVFVNGVLQQHAAEIITNDPDSNGSVCLERDILLTFDDGTTAKLSDLLAPVREQLLTLKDSLQNIYFAKHVVDYIAFSIYYESHDYQGYHD